MLLPQEYDRSCYLVKHESGHRRDPGPDAREQTANAAARRSSAPRRTSPPSTASKGISIGNLAAHIGMSKSGLYAHFGSKEELQLATIETAREIFDTGGRRADANDRRPAGTTAGALRAVSLLRGTPRLPGRLLLRLRPPPSSTPTPARSRTRSPPSNSTGGNCSSKRSEEAQAAGSLDAKEDPSQLAFELEAYLLMGNTAFVLNNDPAHLQQARAAIGDRLSHARRSSN